MTERHKLTDEISAILERLGQPRPAFYEAGWSELGDTLRALVPILNAIIDRIEAGSEQRDNS